MKQALHRFDQTTTKKIVSLFGPSARPFFQCMTVLGDPIAIGIVTIIIVVGGLVQTNIALIVSGAIIPATIVIGGLLKLLFERARPITEYAMNMRLQTFSFPSGHSSGSTIMYGLLAYLITTAQLDGIGLIITILFSVLPVMVGMSRIYLGAHFPSDVVAGWILGLIALGIAIMVVRPML